MKAEYGDHEHDLPGQMKQDKIDHIFPEVRLLHKLFFLFSEKSYKCLYLLKM